ncbi:MAG TPA: hypothetical protein VFB63_32820 [Bryobacteraceae bacterium]|nr:hypothetical protein [Bryobacteraceae bacterium]
MSRLIRFTTMEDAYFCFYQAKGMPDTPQGTIIGQRHLRAAVLLGWVAVDDTIAAFARQSEIAWPKDCRGSAVFPKLQYICRAFESTAPGREEFDKFRALRNRIAHPDGAADTVLTVAEAEEAVGYCKRTIRLMYRHLAVGEEWKGRLLETS